MKPESSTPATEDPLYRRVGDDLLQRIQAGEFPVGSVMPRELDLARQLGVSRVTLRQALQILEKGGVVSRVRRVGTRVIAAAPAATYVQRMDGIEAILRLAGQTAMRIDRISTEAHADWPELQDLPCSTGYWMRIEGARHMQGQQALSTWTTVFVDNRHAGIAPFLQGEVDAVYPLIEQVYGLAVHGLRHRIRACALPPEAARVLGLPAGSPALEVCAWLHAQDGTLIEYVRSLHDPAVISIELFSTRST
ncbi:GntR family transcriptional regulator [Xylophilus sp. ASV27]|uniref:GntR family transcriptional regulator n=1 Tax=Xylophilus sp. ASV27 TaxID=2795129 RepID=UPI0018EDD869|nr:GntR family transcriptional regulator [Xylophilus sp. ASV27]